MWEGVVIWNYFIRGKKYYCLETQAWKIDSAQESIWDVTAYYQRARWHAAIAIPVRTARARLTLSPLT